MAIDLNNPEFVNTWSPHAAWKRALIIYFAGKFGLRTLVETGTSWGDTIAAVFDSFDDIYSIELHPELYQNAITRFGQYGKIHLKHGNSATVLPKILDELSGRPAIFWIDAHPTGGVCANEGIPLEEELRAIYQTSPDSLVLVDDMHPEYINTQPVFTEAGWINKFLNGIVILQRSNLYNIPERF